MVIRRFLTPLLLACLASGCSGVLDPSKNAQDPFSGTIGPNGSVIRDFSWSQNGEIELTMNSVVPTPTNGPLWIYLGQADSTGNCFQLANYPPQQAIVNRTIQFGVLNKGSYCVNVFDPGGVLTLPVNFAVRSRTHNRMTLENPALIWVALAILAAIIEVSIPHFGVIFVSVGAVAAAVVSAFGHGFPVQVIVFIVALGLSLGLLRPRLVNQLGGRGVPSRTDTLIGKEGEVTHDIDPRLGGGRVNVGGEDWAARAATPLPVGSKIRVLRADGIVLEVTPA